jgi:hypothetical protein
MNTQELVVAIIVIVCIAWLVYRKISKRKTGSPCDNCATGCELRSMMLEKQKKCRENNKKTKNCCH